MDRVCGFLNMWSARHNFGPQAMDTDSSLSFAYVFMGIIIGDMVLSLVGFGRVVCRNIGYIKAAYPSISSFCANPAKGVHRLLIFVTAVLGVSMLALQTVEHFSRPDDEMVQFVLESLACFFLPLVGFFHTGGAYLPQPRVPSHLPWSADANDRCLSCGKHFYAYEVRHIEIYGSWFCVHFSSALHSIGTLIFVGVYAVSSSWYAVEVGLQHGWPVGFTFVVAFGDLCVIFFAACFFWVNHLKNRIACSCASEDHCCSGDCGSAGCVAVDRRRSSAGGPSLSAAAARNQQLTDTRLGYASQPSPIFLIRKQALRIGTLPASFSRSSVSFLLQGRLFGIPYAATRTGRVCTGDDQMPSLVRFGGARQRDVYSHRCLRVVGARWRRALAPESNVDDLCLLPLRPVALSNALA